ncbi:uncharacterized protein TNCV_4029471 [Trichonephila clavipes]|nr:uncharacterized protein TNCV_4029471 [Trichonephila clavipes]
MSVIVNESNISKRLSEFWYLENLGIEADVSNEENIDNDIMSEFEAGISYQNKWYKVKFPWKPNMKTLLENNEEIARKRFLKLRPRFKKDSSLFEDYKLVDENPGIDIENKRLDIFRMTRVLFGVKSSPFLLAATIKHHLKKYVDIFPDTFNHLNQSLNVDDFLCGNVSVQAALTTCIESKQILEDASMDLRKWRTNSSELNQRLKNLNFEVDEHKESLNTLIASNVLGVGWNEKSDTFYFDSSDLGTFLSKRINTKRYLLQAAGRLFDPVGFIGSYTIRIKCLIQEIWCLGLDWDDKLPKQLEVSWNKWCNEIHYLSEIKIPRYYFQNFLPSNATTIQLHCFSDASKKAYGTVAYLRIELNDGNIIFCSIKRSGSSIKNSFDP